jgi:hypothetical protein
VRKCSGLTLPNVVTISSELVWLSKRPFLQRTARSIFKRLVPVSKGILITTLLARHVYAMATECLACSLGRGCPVARLTGRAGRQNRELLCREP